ncbi:unnamed protein product (plasmid) [Mycetohabitans rhizoxinica HKI 454]|uniref:Uncharacterized protein n=1 Tax=Mycetohabitans rhizoxinica (strain DSM 19002 / CIP 109453 / HKI 454) TaxID=882378 RepID=E5AV99_MYCRK|nr:unnamed protein product [Mycetohabitans rhizoxinica HKI 454]
MPRLPATLFGHIAKPMRSGMAMPVQLERYPRADVRERIVPPAP